MAIKTLQLDLEMSEKLYNIVAEKKEMQLNDCYINTLAVASYLRTQPKLAKEYKVVYGFMQGVSDLNNGLEDWQYNSYVRHAFLVDRKNRVVDISYIHMLKAGLVRSPSKYITMKRFKLEEYFNIVQQALQENMEKGITDMDITFNGIIRSEEAFSQEMKELGFHIVATDKETGEVVILNK